MKAPVAPLAHTIPPLRATPFLPSLTNTTTILLTDAQREQLVAIGTRVRLPAGMVIYREGSDAHWVFAITDGAVKCYRDLRSGKRIVGAFLFARDLFGLAEQGRYLSTAQAITNVTIYRLPVGELSVLLKHDGEMQFKFLMKVTHELRESQRRAVVLNRRDAPGRLAMFLARMDESYGAATPHGHVVALPMTRSDMAGFLGLSAESVSRAAAVLERRGMVTFEGRHAARIVDPIRLARLAAAV